MADIQVSQQDLLAAQAGVINNNNEDALPVTPNRAQLDLPLADTTEAESSEVIDAPTEATDDAPAEDTEDELSKLLDEEDAENKPEEDKPEEGDFAEKFDAAFQERFGMTPDEATELVTELVAERREKAVRAQLTELQAVWGVDEPVMRERLELVGQYWATLSPEKQAKFDNVKGAQTIYSKLVSMGKVPKQLQSSVSKAQTGQAKHWYTQKQIDSMPLSEYQAQADRISYAIANGLVRK